jgi:hypothetical protein
LGYDNTQVRYLLDVEDSPVSTPLKFRKKPVVVEAMQFDGGEETQRAIVNWANGAVEGMFSDHAILHIYTREGTMTAEPGDWIIRGVKGELYPCKPDIFEATYDAED